MRSFEIDLIAEVKRLGIAQKIRNVYATPDGVKAEIICLEPSGNYGVYEITLTKKLGLEVQGE